MGRAWMKFGIAPTKKAIFSHFVVHAATSNE